MGMAACSLLLKKLITMLEQARNIINNVFKPENVDFQEDLVLVKLEPFLIHNSKGKSHRISDMWVRFALYVEENLVYVRELAGTRSGQTRMEFNNYYNHSHLRKGRLGSTWQPFCRGQGEFASKYRIGSTVGIAIEELETYMMLFRYFLTYEDPTNPYAKIEELVAVSDPPPLIVSRYDLNMHLKHEISGYDLLFNTDYKLIDDPHNHKLLMMSAMLRLERYRVLKINGKYGIPGSNYADSIQHVPEELFTFKGEPVMSRILDDGVILDMSSEYYVNPYQFNQLSNEYSTIIKSKLLQKQNSQRVAAREAYYSAVREFPESEQILVFKNI